MYTANRNSYVSNHDHIGQQSLLIRQSELRDYKRLRDQANDYNDLRKHIVGLLLMECPIERGAFCARIEEGLSTTWTMDGVASIIGPSQAESVKKLVQ